MVRSKTPWKDCYEYRRILEILYDYWISESDEEKVQVYMLFKHKSGERQQKIIQWKNPDLRKQKNEIYKLKPTNLEDVLENCFFDYLWAEFEYS